jgi:sortase A
MARTLKFISAILISSGLIILLVVFGPLIKQEVIFHYNKLIGTSYYIYNNGQDPNGYLKDRGGIIPESTDFGIIIPKINANAQIFPNIDPFSEREFLPILKNGVAHAKNTSFPGHGGNIFLFAHSASSALEIQRYNAVFYLIEKLNQDDEIVIFYKEKPYYYYVFEKKIVSAGAVKYLEEENEEVLTLQTCYPPGTTLKRLIVRAKLKDGS